MSTRNAPRPAAVYGIDIGKNVFHVVGLDSGGNPSSEFASGAIRCCSSLGARAPAIVGMESCAGSQWIARRLQALGHKVRLIPAQFVKPYVKSNKSDIIDAEAIAEAATRPTMRFAAIKSEEQADLQALHRVRDQMIGTRTRLINQMRAFCLEYGIALRQGAGLFKLDLPLVLDDASNDLSPAMRQTSRGLVCRPAPAGAAHRPSDEGDRRDCGPRRCCPSAHDDPRNRGTGRYRRSCGRWQRTPVPEGPRSGCLAGPCSAGTLHGR